MSQVTVRLECQACGATWNPGTSDGTVGAHESRWHDGAQTVRPVTAEVITEQPTPELLVERAAALGRKHGQAGGGWVFDGNTPHDAYVKCLELDEIGTDWWDFYGPTTGPLSGEWADGLNPELLFQEIGGEPLTEEEDGFEDQLAEIAELCTAYEDAYYQAWRDEVLRMAREQVES